MIRSRAARPSDRTRAAPAALVPILLSLLTLPVAASCGPGESATGIEAEWRVTRDTTGDTITVRTVSGSVWRDTSRLVEEMRIGRVEGAPEQTFGAIRGLAVGPDGAIYVLDRQVPALRVYRPDGTYLRTIGSEGSGPGEYDRPDGGVAVLPDGRVLLRDPGNGRINVYAAAGDFLESWRIRGGRFTGQPFYVTDDGRPHHPVFEFTDEGTEWRLVRFSGDGSRADSVLVDHWAYDTPRLEARYESGDNRSFSVANVPFTAAAVWTFSPRGYLVGGVSTEYRFELLRRDEPVLRVEREAEPVPVLQEEKANHRERATASMRNTDPNWSWDGPRIPDAKAPYRSLMADEEGRIWVRRHTRSQPIPEEEIEEPDDGPNAIPPLRWREPLIFDVFASDGRYLGPVRTPEGFQTNPQPVIRGDRVWAVAEDELGVEYVVRYRLVRGEGESAGGP